jgi:ATP-dependent helicase/DNAse subunit B
LELAVEADVFGNVVHGVLEQMYKSFESKTIDTVKLREKLKNIDNYLSNEFASHYKGGDLSTGKNLLIAEVARKYIERFVKRDIDSLNTSGRLLISVEEKLLAEVKEGISFKLTGKIDRIDQSPEDGSIRLIDYKTGSVEQRDLKLTDWEQLTTDPKYSKVFQLLFYCFLYRNSNELSAEVMPGIFSLRKHTRGFQQLILPDKIDISEAMPIFKEQLKELVEKITDPDIPIVQTTEEENCNWCDYKTICNRQGKSSF